MPDLVRQNADVLISLASMLISLCALGYTAYQAHATRRHNRLSMRPHIGSFFDKEPLSKEGKTKIDWHLTNYGLGPAMIKSYDVYLDEERIDTGTGKAIQDALIKALGFLPPTHRMETRNSGDLLAMDATITVLEVEFPTPALDKMKTRAEIGEIGAGIRRFKVVVRYASLYGEDFIVESRGG